MKMKVNENIGKFFDFKGQFSGYEMQWVDAPIKKIKQIYFYLVVLYIGLFFSVPNVLAQSAPYPPSQVITGITFDMSTLDERASGSDNWVITWADDDNQYASYGDGWGFCECGSKKSYGVSRITGSPDAYTTKDLWSGDGKSYGIISVGGILYMWRSGGASDGSAFSFQEILKSGDHGTSWSHTGVKFTSSDFQGSSGFFVPTFLQFGKDYQGARDKYLYSYAPENKDGRWDVQSPGEISLMRVLTTSISDESQYEFFSGLNSAGQPIWTQSAADRKAVFKDAENGVMRTSVSYNPGLKRYLLITQQVSRQKSGNGHIGIYDAPEPWGPWTTVLFENAWQSGLQNGSKTVYWNFSNKWLSLDGKNFVLVYTGAGSDSWGIVKGQFKMSTDSTSPLTSSEDIVRPAIIKVSAVGDPTKVTLIFNEPIDRSSVMATSNYHINNITIMNASLSTDDKTVVLTTSPHSDSVGYVLTVSNIMDRASTPNAIASNTVVAYQFAGGNIFHSDSEGWVFRENTFRNTSNVYATGLWDASVGGSLRVDLGMGVAATEANSGGWSKSIPVSRENIKITFGYRLKMNGTIDKKEHTEIFVSIDDVPVKIGLHDYILHKDGTGASQDSGWTTISVQADHVGIGTHQIIIGAYLSSKSGLDENVSLFLDNIAIGGLEVVAGAEPPNAPVGLVVR